jgi:hypothetical protein
VAASSIAFYGVDENFRIPILQCAGFEVAKCNSIPDFKQLLESVQVDAIVFARGPADDLVDAARNLSSAPLVCFTSDGSSEDDHRVDLVIPTLTRPEEWVLTIEQLLERSRTIRAQSASLRCESASLRTESEAVRKQTRKTIDSIRINRLRHRP